MKKVLLDTNFILTSIRNKIDFTEDIKFLGLEILIPEQVVNELKNILNSKKKLRFKQESKIALKLIIPFKKIDLKFKNTDNGIINFAKNNPDIIIATLDREIKKKIKNPKLIIRNKKKLEII
ncbi:hypothetical protein DRN73_02550 [Candidatus Pacearchaeota archaeon]|nr:MAG: hypothetical protein DRN73_02550 [Candidatus Pacearchaeota archaeon]